MIKKVLGDRRGWSYPSLVEDGVTAVTDKEKAKLLANTFVQVHSSDHLSEEGKEGQRHNSRVG